MFEELKFQPLQPERLAEEASHGKVPLNRTVPVAIGNVTIVNAATTLMPVTKLCELPDYFIRFCEIDEVLLLKEADREAGENEPVIAITEVDSWGVIVSGMLEIYTQARNYGIKDDEPFRIWAEMTAADGKLYVELQKIAVSKPKKQPLEPATKSLGRKKPYVTA